MDEAVGLYHASPRDPVWEYVLSPLQAELCLDVQAQRVCLIGHSHVALSFSRVPEGARPRPDPGADEELDLTAGRVAAQPRQRRPAARRGPAGGLARARPGRLAARIYRRTEYDIAGAAAAIRAARLPDSLAERLHSASEAAQVGLEARRTLCSNFTQPSSV